MSAVAVVSLVVASLQLGWDVFSNTKDVPVLDKDPILTIRLQGGYGYIDSEQFKNGSDLSNFGVRMMRNKGSQRYGFEVNRLTFKGSGKDLSVGDSVDSYGIVLEQKLGSGVIASFGVMGYKGYSSSNATLAGTVVNLGWEPKSKKGQQFQPFIAYRSDTIYGGESDTIHSLNLGITWSSLPAR